MGLPSSIENVAESGWENVKHALGEMAHAGKSAWSDALAEAQQLGRQLSDPNNLTNQLGHTALDAVGLVPIVGAVAEGVNAGWYAAQGDPADAALSGAAAIPVVGDAADAARLTEDSVGIARDAERIAHDVHGAEKIEKAAGAGEVPSPKTSIAKPPDPIRTGGGGGGDAGGPPKGPDTPEGEYPIGLAYRIDLPQHLTGSKTSISRGALQGTHNLDNAKSALESRGAYPVRALEKGKPGYTITPTGTDGILEIHYQMRSATNGRVRAYSKTVYDPTVHSDQAMLRSALKVGEEAFRQYKTVPTKTAFDLYQDGIKFRVHIKVDKRTRAPYVANVHPIGY